MKWNPFYARERSTYASAWLHLRPDVVMLRFVEGALHPIEQSTPVLRRSVIARAAAVAALAVIAAAVGAGLGYAALAPMAVAL